MAPEDARQRSAVELLLGLLKRMSRRFVLACGSPLPVKHPSVVSCLETIDSDLCTEAEYGLPDVHGKTVVTPDFVVSQRQGGPCPRGEFRD